MAKKKYYAVKNGEKTGIFESWAECEKSVKGYKNAQYKSFENLAEAKAYLYGDASCENEKNKSDQKNQKEKKLPPENEIYAYTDGSYNIKTGVYGYGVVLVFSDGEEKTFFGSDDNEEIASMRNVAGELKGACVAMQYAYKNGYKKITIFHDYEGVSKWAEKKWKTNLSYTKKYAEYAWKMGEKVEIAFSKVLAHSGVELNEKADILAKKAVGLLDEAE